MSRLARRARHGHRPTITPNSPSKSMPSASSGIGFVAGPRKSSDAPWYITGMVSTSGIGAVLKAVRISRPWFRKAEASHTGSCAAAAPCSDAGRRPKARARPPSSASATAELRRQLGPSFQRTSRSARAADASTARDRSLTRPSGSRPAAVALRSPASSRAPSCSAAPVHRVVDDRHRARPAGRARRESCAGSRRWRSRRPAALRGCAASRGGSSRCRGRPCGLPRSATCRGLGHFLAVYENGASQLQASVPVRRTPLSSRYMVAS